MKCGVSDIELDRLSIVLTQTVKNLKLKILKGDKVGGVEVNGPERSDEF